MPKHGKSNSSSPVILAVGDGTLCKWVSICRWVTKLCSRYPLDTTFEEETVDGSNRKEGQNTAH